MGKITFVPVGGLANRMRAVASAVTLAAKSDSVTQPEPQKNGEENG